ncbi:biotin carboxylase [Affinibrenneria salicis]|uniref:Biotin carboxylase n=1 Tax=Affinibrenneria salicis TaxID=2590031 RepID=A0A5J5G4E5_9GAMM|nr:biotin carboxylase [Affinibrenneria salicis]KAA9001725.1 biotin carboxylase [Affinibrenneria salicis]
MKPAPVRYFLIIDYNLAQAGDVKVMSDYARQQYHVKTVLIRPDPSDRDWGLCDIVFDLNPLSPDFVEEALDQLAAYRQGLAAGVVFSDNAVHSGAQLLRELGLPVDSDLLALNAFDKYAYRQREYAHRELFHTQRVLVPACRKISSLSGLQQFAAAIDSAFVLKPACEDNNRGVVVVNPGDDLAEAFREVAPYLSGGVMCEEKITFGREFSFDGVGIKSFITEKVSADGRYPVEIAQILPARLMAHEQITLTRAGLLANLIVGQRNGPFHNEIKLNDDGSYAAIVEANRRPAGMNIWLLASKVYGVNFFRVWVDAVFGVASSPILPLPVCQAATVMLGVKATVRIHPSHQSDLLPLLERARQQVLQQLGLERNELLLVKYHWVNLKPAVVHAVPHDGSDFAAWVCLTLQSEDIDMLTVVHQFRRVWLDIFHQHQPLAIDMAV